MPITTRIANESDIDFISSSNVAMAAETEDLGLNPQVLALGIRYLMAHRQEGFYLVAEQDGSAVGTLMVTYEWSDWRNGRFWWIQSVYVPAEFRRRGVYRVLHNAVRELAQQDSQSCGIRLYVEQENAAAQATYRAIGMAQTHYRLYEEAIERG